MALASSLGSAAMHFPKRGRQDGARRRVARTLRSWLLYRRARARQLCGPLFSQPRRPCYAPAMGQDRVEQAIGRIESALARIESAAGRASQSAGSTDNGLRESHESLRGQVREALARLDGLIARAEGG